MKPAAANPIDPQLLTTEDVMERLLANPHLKRLAATCVLPALRDGSQWRFRRSDLDAWIDRQLSRPGTAGH